MNPEQGSYDVIIDYNLEPEIYSLRGIRTFCQSIAIEGNSAEISYSYQGRNWDASSWF